MLLAIHNGVYILKVIKSNGQWTDNWGLEIIQELYLLDWRDFFSSKSVNQ
jgi:hypothetical protein